MKDTLLVYINIQELLCKLFVIILCITIMSILSGLLYFLLNVKGILASQDTVQGINNYTPLKPKQIQNFFLYLGLGHFFFLKICYVQMGCNHLYGVLYLPHTFSY